MTTTIHLDPAAFEAAKNAHVRASHNGTYSPKALPAAITAYLAAIEPQVRAAVATYAQSVNNIAHGMHVGLSDEQAQERLDAWSEARTALFALLGMTGTRPETTKN